MTEKSIEIKMAEDFDARPIAMLVQIASRHESSIHLVAEGKKVNAKSIMGIMAFNPTEGMNLDIVATGEDEKDALDAIERFLVCE